MPNKTYWVLWPTVACLLFVVCLSVMHALWLNGTSYQKNCLNK